MGAALVVLAVASLNVANMQLARGASRRKEMAMRLALGAGRIAIVRQLLIEGLLLALAGGAAGLLLGVWAMHLVVSSLAPLVEEAFTVVVAPDWRVCLASLLFCVLAAVISGLGPAWRSSRLDLLPEMRSPEGAGAGSGFRRFGTRNLLVAGQIALSLALLAASGLFVRATVVARGADPGYRFDRQYLVRLDAKSGGHDGVSGREAYARLLERVRSLPAVESAALASVVAFSNESPGCRVWRADGARAPEAGTARGLVARSYDIGGAYFRTLGLPMLRGREFTEAEARDPNATGVAIIDEPLAAALFPGADPLGQLVQGSGLGSQALRIVGVAPGLRNRLADPRPVPHIYLPLGPRYQAVTHIHVRAAQGAEPGNLRQRLRDVVRSPDTRLAALWIRTLGDARDASPQAWLIRSAGQTFGAFGAIALLMATIGLYGVKAYAVARRTREIGIRMALGAQAADVIRMVVRDGAVLLAASVVVGTRPRARRRQGRLQPAGRRGAVRPARPGSGDRRPERGGARGLLHPGQARHPRGADDRAPGGVATRTRFAPTDIHTHVMRRHPVLRAGEPVARRHRLYPVTLYLEGTAENMLDSDMKRGSTELLVLALLEERPRHGYEIGKLIESRSSGQLTFSIPALYPTLSRMEDRGWIEGRWLERPGTRRRRFYSLTPGGRKVLASQRRAWQAFVAAVAQVAGLNHA